MDMVCEKTPEKVFHFETDPLQLQVRDGWVMATDTTLGADDGYGVAYMLAILDADDIPHPALECFFSVQEEVGIGGPRGMDYSQLSARRYINLDGVQEGSTNVSTANVIGGDFKRPIVMQENSKPCYTVHLRPQRGPRLAEYCKGPGKCSQAGGTDSLCHWQGGQGASGLHPGRHHPQRYCGGM